jgi:hypothetical protein
MNVEVLWQKIEEDEHGLRVSHRERDAERCSEWQPYQLHRQLQIITSTAYTAIS